MHFCVLSEYGDFCLKTRRRATIFSPKNRHFSDSFHQKKSLLSFWEHGWLFGDACYPLKGDFFLLVLFSFLMHFLCVCIIILIYKKLYRKLTYSIIFYSNPFFVFAFPPRIFILNTHPKSSPPTHPSVLLRKTSSSPMFLFLPPPLIILFCLWTFPLSYTGNFAVPLFFVYFLLCT